MAIKTFKGRVPSQARTFDMESPDGTVTLTVQCNAAVPGSVFLDFLGGATDPEDYAAMARITKEVINACIAPEAQEGFWAFCAVPENGIDIETLSEIAGYLSELFAGERPLEPSPA